MAQVIECDRCGASRATFYLIPTPTGYLKADLCNTCIEQFQSVVYDFINVAGRISHAAHSESRRGQDKRTGSRSANPTQPTAIERRSD